MRKLLLYSLTFLLYGQLYSQEVEGLMTRKSISCNDIIYNSAFLIPEHFEKNNMDTVAAIVNYWENQCGIIEPLLRIKILLAIKADTLNENIYSNLPIIIYLLNYREKKRAEVSGVEFGDYFGTLQAMKLFDNFTQELAIELKKKENSELDNFFLDFYSNNFEKIFWRLQDTTLTGSNVEESYDSEVSKYINRSEGHFSVYSGTWLPIGNLSIVGIHPIIGFQAGLKIRKVLIDGVLELKLGNSPNVYFVQKDDSLYSTTHFFGGFLGLELGYELMNFKSFEVDFLAGSGWDGFDVLSIGSSSDPNRITKTISALNFNLGIGFRKYFRNRSYIGIETRYNFINYSNPKGTDLSGNTLTIRLKHGVSRNLDRDRNLMRLDNQNTLSSEKYYEWLQTGGRTRSW
jgi:hypothetical protein